MSVFKYAALYEDVAHKKFAAHVMPHIVQQGNFNVGIEEIDNFRIRAQNRGEVDKFCTSASKEAFVNDQYLVDFFVVCRDTDSHDSQVCQRIESELAGKLHHAGSGKTILCLPVQCIEHWLLYLKLHRDNPTSTKNESIESIPRNRAKLEVYGRLKPGQDRCIAVVEEYCQNIDVHWLESRSQSFLKFAANVRTVMQYLIDKNR